MKEFFALLKLQFTILIKNKYEIYNQIAFFLIFIVSFPLIGRFSDHILRELAPSIILIISYFMLSIYQPELWFKDKDDGTLEQQIIFTSFPKVIAGKFLIGFSSNLLMLYILLPLFSQLYNLDLYETLSLALTLFFFTLSISAILAITSILCLSSKNLGLIYIISFPFSLSTLILSYDFFYNFNFHDIRYSDLTLLFNSIFSLIMLILLAISARHS